jgi:hypothetical protein
MPVLSQSLGTCYGYTAAQMVDSYRFLNGDKDKDHHSFPLAPAFHSKDTWYFRLFYNYIDADMAQAVTAGKIWHQF